MAMRSGKKEILSKADARRIWIQAQQLDQPEPFGAGPSATQAAIEHLGYVQIDTINVIERCHHHILYNRIPQYRRRDLQVAQSKDKSVFEYWTHALSYVPARDFRYFAGEMKRVEKAPGTWFHSVKPEEVRKVLRLIKKEGPISIRDIEDDALVEKDHPWGSRKPSKKALQFAFFSGRLVISERVGMLKKYELIDRHFGWSGTTTKRPRPATERETLNYKLDRALRSQGLVSLDSICHLEPKRKPQIQKIIDQRVKRGELLEVHVQDLTKPNYWMTAEVHARDRHLLTEQTHILSPFDPLTIQRKRLLAFFDYAHRFEAYLPLEKRVYGYFALPVLAGEKIVAALDLKADRSAKKLRIQKWTWVGKSKSRELKMRLEAELHRFERFQLEND